MDETYPTLIAVIQKHHNKLIVCVLMHAKYVTQKNKKWYVYSFYSMVRLFFILGLDWIMCAWHVDYIVLQ